MSLVVKTTMRSMVRDGGGCQLQVRGEGLGGTASQVSRTGSVGEAVGEGKPGCCEVTFGRIRQVNVEPERTRERDQANRD